jgi:uncharacterized NAD(P)/FAD-binding protein YdhS
MSDDPRTIAIIGAGFSGVTVATNLLNQRHTQRLRILLLDRLRIARGTAYAEREYPYILNVPAGRMSADSTAPLEFLHFARRRFEGAMAEDFLPRALYGEYLEWKLHSAEASTLPGVQLVRVPAEVRGITRGREDALFTLQLADRRVLTAHEVILALGTPPPRELPQLALLRGSEAYIHNPWRAPLALGSPDTVLILGTGLTMADVALAVAANAKGNVLIHALSRHGWLPVSQSVGPTGDCGVVGELLLQAASVSIRKLYRAIRCLVDDLQRRGGDWRDAINSVRLCAPLLWERLALNERRRFLRHLRTLWEIHRHRLPRDTVVALDQLRVTGLLRVHAGHLISCEPCGRRIGVRWRPRGSAEISLLTVDRIVNCTGGNHNVRALQEPLWQALLSEGTVCPDPLGLGLRTGEHGIVINADGEPVDNLYYIGPMLQADHWESTAVAELRRQAEGLVRHLMTRQFGQPGLRDIRHSSVAVRGR